MILSGLALGPMQLAIIWPMGRHSPTVHRGSGSGSPAFWATATVAEIMRRNVEIRHGSNIVEVRCRTEENAGADVDEVGGV